MSSLRADSDLVQIRDKCIEMFENSAPYDSPLARFGCALNLRMCMTTITGVLPENWISLTEPFIVNEIAKFSKEVTLNTEVEFAYRHAYYWEADKLWDAYEGWMDTYEVNNQDKLESTKLYTKMAWKWYKESMIVGYHHHCVIL